MSNTSRMANLVFNKDTRQFLKYTIRHPLSAKREKIANRPGYLTQNEILLTMNDDDILIKSIINSESGKTELDEKEDVSFEFTSVLAGEEVLIDSSRIDWFKEYSDSEDVAALHRFIWLYKYIFTSIDKKDKRKLHELVKTIIYDWIDNVENINNLKETHFEIWQTYTVAERLTNWLLVLSITANNDFKDEKIVKSVVRQMNYIYDNLEYYGEKFTGNHLLNDGKALYIVGQILGIASASKAGKEIIMHEFKRVVPDGMFLREGSTHYQFLLTKWITDCYWIAQNSNDADFAETLKIKLNGLLNGCRSILVRTVRGWEIPLIGDISPDIPPEWIIGVPWVTKYLIDGHTYGNIPTHVGYHTFYLKGARLVNENVVCNIPRNPEWGKLSNNVFSVFMHVNHIMYPNNLTGHFHHDSSGVVVYANGEPLFVDCGRKNYSLNKEAIRGKNYSGHNILTIDGHNFELDMRTFFSEEFLKNYVEKAPEMKITEDTLMSTVYGNKRLTGLLQYKREVKVNNNQLIMSDSIMGDGKHQLQILLNIPMEYIVCTDEKEFIVNTQKHIYKICFAGIQDELLMVKNGACDDTYGHRSLRYGKDEQCHTCIVRFECDFPVKIDTYVLQRE